MKEEHQKMYVSIKKYMFLENPFPFLSHIPDAIKQICDGGVVT